MRQRDFKPRSVCNRVVLLASCPAIPAERIPFLHLSSPPLLSFLPLRGDQVQNSPWIPASHLELALSGSLDLSCMHSLSLWFRHSVNTCGPSTMFQHSREHRAALTGFMGLVPTSESMHPAHSPLHPGLLDHQVTYFTLVSLPRLETHEQNHFLSFVHTSSPPLLQQVPWQHWECTRDIKDELLKRSQPSHCASCSGRSAAGSPKCPNVNDSWAITEDSVCSQYMTWGWGVGCGPSEAPVLHKWLQERAREVLGAGSSSSTSSEAIPRLP